MRFLLKILYKMLSRSKLIDAKDKQLRCSRDLFVRQDPASCTGWLDKCNDTQSRINTRTGKCTHARAQLTGRRAMRCVLICLARTCGRRRCSQPRSFCVTNHVCTIVTLMCTPRLFSAHFLSTARGHSWANSLRSKEGKIRASISLIFSSAACPKKSSAGVCKQHSKRLSGLSLYFTNMFVYFISLLIF